jgi:hypothetical protein
MGEIVGEGWQALKEGRKKKISSSGTAGLQV